MSESCKWRTNEREVSAMPDPLLLTVVPADKALAQIAARLRAATAEAGLSLGDRFCLELAQRDGLPAWTSDQNWKKIADFAEVRVLRSAELARLRGRQADRAIVTATQPNGRGVRPPWRSLAMRTTRLFASAAEAAPRQQAPLAKCCDGPPHPSTISPGRSVHRRNNHVCINPVRCRS